MDLSEEFEAVVEIRAGGYRDGILRAAAMAEDSRQWADTPEEVERWNWYIARLRAEAGE